MENQKRRTPNDQINAKLRQARVKRFWTLQKTATEVGVSFTTYLRWEMGKQTPSLISLEKLCQIFERTPQDLGYGHLMGSDAPSPKIPPSGEKTADHLMEEETETSPPLRSRDNLAQIHLQLIALAKELFPQESPPRINRFQDGQKTLHVFCDTRMDKSAIASIKTLFRSRSDGWTLGVERKS
jgi:transcriptional regulator with XRE-family HTH domain